MHQSALAVRLDHELTLANFRVILINSLSGFNDATPLAEILQYEPIQAAGGYQSQPYSYTTGTSTFDAAIGWQKAPDVTINFTEALAGAGYGHTHVCLWQGRGARSNKPIEALDTATDLLTVTAHGLASGDRAFIRSTGTLPAGAAIQRYWVKAISLDTLELYTDQALTTKLNLTDTGLGSLHLQYANGALFDYASNIGQVNAGQTKPFLVSYQVQ